MPYSSFRELLSEIPGLGEHGFSLVDRKLARDFPEIAAEIWGQPMSVADVDPELPDDWVREVLMDLGAA